MEAEIKLFKRKFNRSLQPIKVMLANRKTTLSPSGWLALVEKTKTGIISHPNDYIDVTLPSQETICYLVEDIFDQFVKDQISRHSG